MIILDVRTKPEFENQHVEGAINYDLQLLMAGQLPDIPKDEEIVAYCNSGNCSGTAETILRQHGFKNVSNGGGVSDMRQSGYQLA